MPNKNGTGPEGKGPKTGRGLGPCGNGSSGTGVRRVFKRGLGLRRNVDRAREENKEN